MSKRLFFSNEKYRDLPLEVKSSVAYAACSIIQNCISFITIPLFTRLLTTAQYGECTVYDSWLVIITIFATLYMPYGTLTKALSKYEGKGEQYISNIQTIMAVHIVGLLLLYLLLRKWINNFLGFPTYLIVTMLFQILMSAAVQCWSQKKRFQLRYKEVIIYTLINSLVSPLLMYLLIINTQEKGYAKILGGAIVGIFSGGIIFIINMIKGKSFFSKEYWRYAYTFNLPLVIYYLSQVIFNQSDRLMIDKICGKDKAGIYGVAYMLALVLTFVLNAINNSYIPWIYKKINLREHQDNRKISNIIAVILTVLLSGVIWFAPEIIWILAGKSYVEAIWVVPPVAVSLLLLFYVQLFVNIDFYFENKIHMIISSSVSAAANILLNVIFIPIYGYWAAGYTTFISYVLFAGLEYIMILPKIKVGGELEGIYDIKTLIAILLLFCLFSFGGMAMYGCFYARLILAAFVLILLFIFRNKLKKKYINNSER